MIYLIGGAARCGKSTLARRVRREVDGYSVPGDAFLHAMREVLPAEAIPELCTDTFDPVAGYPADDQKIDRLRRRDRAMWQFHAAYLRSVAYESDSNIVLDADLWPDFIADLQLPHKAVFLIDTSPDQAARIRALRDDPTIKNNWMRQHNYSDERIADWARFNALRSQRYVELHEQYGDHPYFDVGQQGIAGVSDVAFEYLLK